MGRKRMLGIAIAAAGLLLPLAGCAGDTNTKTTTNKEGLTEVHLGFLPLAGYAAVFLGQEQGFFEEEGLEVIFDTITDPANGIANLTSGSLHFSLITPGSLAVALTQNVPLKEVSPLYFTNGEQGIYAAEDGPIDSVQDLEGKTVGLGSLASTVEAGVAIQLEEAGVDPDSVDFTLVPIGNTASTLLAGRIDAALISEPSLSTNRDQVVPIIPDPFAPFGENSIVAVMATSAQFAQENPDVVAAFQRAMAKAQAYAAENEDEVRQAIIDNTDTDPAIVEEMVLPGFGATFDVESQILQAESMVDQGFAEELPDLEGAIIQGDAFDD